MSKSDIVFHCFSSCSIAAWVAFCILLHFLQNLVARMARMARHEMEGMKWKKCGPILMQPYSTYLMHDAKDHILLTTCVVDPLRMMFHDAAWQWHASDEWL